MSDFRIKIYKKLQNKIQYLGVQENRHGAIHGYVFLDRLTDSSFLIKNTVIDYEKAILAKLAKMKKSFEEAKCD